jgi:hypothetical protein
MLIRRRGERGQPFAQSDPLRYAAIGRPFHSGPFAAYCNGPVSSNVGRLDAREMLRVR